MLQHLRFSRAPGGHAASIAGTSTKGGSVKLSPSESVDAFLGCGKYADRSSLPAEHIKECLLGQYLAKDWPNSDET